MNKPVLFLIFNRPKTTKKVFDVIKDVEPDRLFIAADGPRKNKQGEESLCDQTRKITENIDWPCEVKRLYREENLGCKNAVSSAIDWFFENVEEGIILEDDSLPDKSFFWYCSELLTKYRNNAEIMHIGSNNFQDGISRGTGSYYFSKYPHIWGWASWRRAWKNYSVDISNWRNEKSNKIFKDMGVVEKIFWKSNFDSVANGAIDTWDYQWVYAIWLNSGICISPNRNLVINIGVGKNSTHIKTNCSYIDNMKLNEISILKHPQNKTIDKEADNYTLKNVFGVSIINLSKIMIISPYFIFRKLTNAY